MNNKTSNSTPVLPCLNLGLRMANRVISQIYDGYLSNCGVKATQFSILRAVYLLKETTNRQLQDILVLDQTTLSRGLKPLIRDGYIAVNPGADRRIKQLSLTATGVSLYKQAELKWMEAQQAVGERLGTELTEQLLEVSSAVVKLKY